MRAKTILLATLVVLTASIAAEAQTTLYFVRDRITDPSGGVIAVATPVPSDTTAPSTPTGLAASSVSATAATLSWSASSDSGGSGLAGYRLYRGNVLVAAVGNSTTSFTDSSLIYTTTYPYKVAAFDNAGNQSSLSSAVNVTAAPPNPSGLTATGASSSQVNLTWTAAGGTISHYVVERKTTGSWSSVGTPSTNSFSDTSVSANTSYKYRVKAVDAGSNSSSYTNEDIATAVTFTDSTITAGSTVIKAAHITELRTAVNALRTLAGLSAASWTDSTLTAGTTGIKAVHISELRSNLNAALTALSIGTPTYTDSTLTAGTTVIKRVHVVELRQYVN